MRLNSVLVLLLILAVGCTSATGTTPSSDSDTSGASDPGPDIATGAAATTDPYANLALHAGYWIRDDGMPVEAYDNRPLLSHSMHHVDVSTRRMTVDAQTLLNEAIDGTGADVVVSPPQLDPGTCGLDPIDGRTVCAHANAVYLNGSGQEQTTSDGTGTWWSSTPGSSTGRATTTVSSCRPLRRFSTTTRTARR